MANIERYFLFIFLAAQSCYSQELLSEKELKMQTAYLSIPEIIDSEKQLLSLHVVETKGLKIIPESIFEHSEIQMLDIGGAAIGSISNKIGGLKSLQYLVLAGDSLTEIPDLFEMSNLKELRLNANYISKIPTWLFQNPNLSALDFSNQFVNTVELPNIGNNNTLRTLDLSDNQLEIAKGFFNFTSLEHLDLSNCHLISVPEEISNCQSIKYLNLSGNKIRMLPEWIFKMKNLSQIILSNTDLETFPEKLVNIPTLTFIDVRDTKMELSAAKIDKIIKDRANRFLEIYWETGTRSIRKIN